MEQLRDVRLSDRYDLAKSPVLLSGVQALVRATLMQRARDRAAGLDTAGHVTGYRGSPLGGVDGTFMAAGKFLAEAPVVFQHGLNEDLAATALWGSQQATMRGEGKHDGVFGLWYGKGPGVDRSGDVFRHANFAGTDRHGGVLVAMGDDHTCESSTTCHQSDLALIDAHLPVLAPASVQDLLDLMIAGWELSRFSGLWVGIKCLKDIVEATGVVDGDPRRMALVRPAFEMPDGGLNIRPFDVPQEAESRLVDFKVPAAKAFAFENRLDGRVHGARGARIGIVSAGKAWSDTVHALEMLGIKDDAERLGLTTYKVGMTWPLEPRRLVDWAEGLDLIVVAEEKRGLVETQIREELYHLPHRPRVVGKRDLSGAELFTSRMDLDPARIALGLARVLEAEGVDAGLAERAARLRAFREVADTPQLAERKPWFCAGCPHNTSTRVPDGARASGGIGCHYMALWMDRETHGHTHMGGEGANWIGEAPFSKREHVFQNIGDGTYNHSGLMAIRAAIAAGTNITFKILYNDAVAMTGGQKNEGDLSPERIAAEVMAAGVSRIVCVYDEKEGAPTLPTGVAAFERDRLDHVQQDLAGTPGVSVLLYVQTCATEKRRRAKRGQMQVPDERVFINPSVCEGCGDCGVQSNCVAIVPHETPLGRKRRIDQSACNKDFSCLKGFCPSFVTVEGATPKAAEPAQVTIPDLPEPAVPALERPWNVMVTGIGGTGVVTVGALMTMAAHLEGKGAAEMQMAGLAQKGGAVSIHCRLAPTPAGINAVRLAPGEADAVIGGDIVTTAAPKVQALMSEGRTGVICNTHEQVTGEFTRNIDFSLPTRSLEKAIRARVGERLAMVDGTRLAEKLMGDAIFANTLLMGAAWQAGLIPLSEAALMKAIELNGAAVEKNKHGFRLGRWAVAFPEQAAAAMADEAPREETLDEKIERRAKHLTGYQNAKLAGRYRRLVTQARARSETLGEAVALGYFKLLSYKDEYEVARLHAETLDDALAANFDNVRRVRFHMAPPLISPIGEDGRPKKRRFGPWMARAFRVLRHGKVLRGTAFDPFGYSSERRAERQAIRDYEALMAEVLDTVTPETEATAAELAKLPLEVRGFGPVKAANAEKAAERQAVLLERLRSGAPTPPMAQAAE